MAGYVIKYKASVYQSKINSLESCTSQLSSHLDTLESYKEQLTTFWDDEQAAKYVTQITDQILKVRHAMNEVADLKRVYQETIDKMSGGATVVDDIIDDVDRAVNTYANVVSSVGDIIPG
ncbi:MAG: hypothetical protein LUH07_11210 [Lachnospiraceae bacterium]|nr:hypothetical protein [Lachnospiraceae bacterium]